MVTNKKKIKMKYDSFPLGGHRYTQQQQTIHPIASGIDRYDRMKQRKKNILTTRSRSNNAFNNESSDFPNSEPKKNGIKNSDLSDDELSKVNDDSISSSCLSGTIGCCDSLTQFTHAGDLKDFDNDNWSFHVDVSQFINNKDSNNKGSKYGLYIAGIYCYCCCDIFNCTALISMESRKQKEH